MFGNTTEKRVLREAHKIVSMKEDMDALSWSRVLELGRRLQDEAIPTEELSECGRELVSIAQSNLSLYSRLGIDPAPARVMSSGIEVLEGGFAEAAIKEQERQGAQASDVRGVAASSAEEAPSNAKEPEAFTLDFGSETSPATTQASSAPEVSEQMSSHTPIDIPIDVLVALSSGQEETSDVADAGQAVTANLPTTEDVSASLVGEELDESDFIEAEESVRERRESWSTTELPIDLSAMLGVAVVSGSASEKSGVQDSAPVECHEPELMPEPETQTPPVPLPSCVSEPEDVPEPCLPATEPVMPEPEPTPAPAAPAAAPVSPEPEQPAQPPVEATESDTRAASRHRRPARFRNLYESRDGSLCVFEDEHGHLVAVDTSKLA